VAFFLYHIQCLIPDGRPTLHREEPISFRATPNPYGSAPGWWVERAGKILVAMPGPPVETHPMWDDQVAPRLRQMATGQITLTRNIKTIGEACRQQAQALIQSLILYGCRPETDGFFTV